MNFLKSFQPSSWFATSDPAVDSLRPARMPRNPGLSRPRRRVGSVLAAVALASGACGDATGPEPLARLECTRDAVTAGDQTIAVAPDGYAVVGNRIISAATCEPHRFAGVSVTYLTYSPTSDRVENPALLAADLAQMRTWEVNALRIALNQSYWLKSSRHFDAGYADRVDRVVQAARSTGMSVILDLHVTDRGDPAYAFTGSNPHQQHADVNHSIPFWREVAAKYKNDGGVVFELYNEAYDVSWEVWRNGGTIPDSTVYGERRGAFQAAGYQQLYDAVRSTGANNLVIVAGTHWGYFLDGVASNRISGHNIAYAAHPWNWPDKQPGTWDRDWGSLADTDPVIISEFGTYDCQPRYVTSVLDYADRKKMSWIAWAWKAPAPGESASQAGPTDPVCSFPMLITDWNGTPSEIGKVIQARLKSY